MQVGEVLNGVPAGQKEIEIVTGQGGGDCGYRFEQGVDYAVYAYTDTEGRLATGICSGTRILSQAAEDLRYFHAMAAAPAAGELHVQTGLPDNPGKPGEWIRVEKEGSRYTAQTDAAGVATFALLPPGEYTIHANSDGDLPDDPKVRLSAKGCQDVTLFGSRKLESK